MEVVCTFFNRYCYNNMQILIQTRHMSTQFVGRSVKKFGFAKSSIESRLKIKKYKKKLEKASMISATLDNIYISRMMK
jgi:hypothetical protein